MNFQKALFKLEGKKLKRSIYDKLAVQLEYGINLKDALNELTKRAKRNNKSVAEFVLKDIKSKVSNGKTFADAVKSWVPALDYTIIFSAEKAGKLPEILRLINDIDDMKSDLKKQFLGGLISPAILLAAVYGLLFYLGKYALPSILQITKHVSGFAVILIYMTKFTDSIWLFLVPVIVIALVIAIIYSFPVLTGDVRKKLDNIFPWTIYRKFTGAIWLIGLSGLISAGVNETQALKEMTDYSNNYLKERLKTFYKGMQNGLNLGEAMQNSGFDFPDKDTVDDIVVFSNFPEFDKKLNLISKANIKETKEKISAVSKILSFIFNMLVYVLILLIVAGSMSLIMNISTSVNKF